MKNIVVTDIERTKTRELISEAQNITVLGHHNPDGDCFTVMIAVSYLLKEVFHKNVDLVFKGVILNEFQKYSEAFNVPLESMEPEKYEFTNKDLLVIVDMAESARSNRDLIKLDLSKFKKVLIIDHHSELHNEDAYITHRVCKERASCAEVVSSLFTDEITGLPEKNKALLSELLFFGILEDSKSFLIHSVTPETFDEAAKLAHNGFNIHEFMYGFRSRPLEFYKYFGALIDGIQESVAGFRYVFFDQDKLPKDTQLKELVLNYFKFETQMISDGDVYIFFQNRTQLENGTYQYSIRLRSQFTDMTNLTNKLIGGGGHANSSGGNLIAVDDKDALRQIEEKYHEFKGKSK